MKELPRKRNFTRQENPTKEPNSRNVDAYMVWQDFYAMYENERRVIGDYSCEINLYHVHWKDKRYAKQGAKIHGRKKTGGEDKKTNRAIARKIGQCCYVVEEVKARRNLIKGIL